MARSTLPVSLAYDPAESIRIENAIYRLDVSRQNGAITRLLDKVGGLDLIREQRLANNFKFSLPIPGKEAWQATEGNYILGKDQPLTSAETRDSNLTLRWIGPLTNELGVPYDVSVTMTIDLAGDEIRFGLQIRNMTEHEIGEVYYPILGGIIGLDKNEGDESVDPRATELLLPSGTGIHSDKIFHTFQNFSWLGALYPEQFYPYPELMPMPWMQFYHPGLKRGMYFGAHDPVARHKVLRLEMAPGIAPRRVNGNWPSPDERGGLPTGVKLCYVHIAYHPAGEDFEASPVVLKFHDGDWRSAARIYREWFTGQFHLPELQETWMRQRPAYQDCGSVPYRDLPQWALDGREYGVDALLVSGWKTGGDNDGIPRFEPDPRLGSIHELTSALRDCHQLDVKVFFLINIQPVAQNSEWYRAELYKYACIDRWGVPYTVMGDGGGDAWRRESRAPWVRTPWYSSPAAEKIGGGERRVWLNPGSAGLRDLLVGQIKQLAELGVDGVHLQNFFGKPLDFNPRLDATPDRACWEGSLQCLGEILKTCRSLNPDFCISIDGVGDHLLRYTDVSSVGLADSSLYGAPAFRAEMVKVAPSVLMGDASAFKAAFPFWQPTMSITRSDQFDVVNDALLYGAQLRIAPLNHTASLRHGSVQGLAAYINEILNIRKELGQMLATGEYLGAEYVHVQGEARYSTFRDPITGRKACVLVNDGPESVQVTVSGFQGCGEGMVVVYQPFERPQKATLPVTIQLSAARAAVVVENSQND